jgi:zinc transport system permease protein
MNICIMKDVLMDDFILRALIAGILIATVVGPLGCFVVWRRMAYFGDSLSHSALLGIALGLLTGLGATFGTLAICFSFAALLLWLQNKRILATDTLLGILAHSALSSGIVAMSFVHHARVDLYAYLFGDILTVTTQDIYVIGAGSALVLTCLLIYWVPLLMMTIHEDLAKAEGVHTYRQQMILIGLMTLIVAISIRMVGIMLITSLLIIPAACARQIARSPEGMAITAAIIGIVSVALGICASLQWNTPTGPSMVCSSALLFVCVFFFSGLTRRR